MISLQAEVDRLRGVLEAIAATESPNAAEMRVVDLARHALRPYRTAGTRAKLSDLIKSGYLGDPGVSRR